MLLPNGYQIREGSRSDLPILLKFIYLTYQELFPSLENFSHLTKIVENLFSSATPLWFAETIGAEEITNESIAICWMGNAIDSVSGARYAQIYLVYVDKKHRRKGIASALIDRARNWAKSRGDRQIGLMVSSKNQPALNLYRNLGFEISFQLMTQPLSKQETINSG